MSEIIPVRIPKSDVKVAESDSSFESRVVALALEKMKADDIENAEAYHLADIEVEGDDYVALMRYHSRKTEDRQADRETIEATMAQMQTDDEFVPEFSVDQEQIDQEQQEFEQEAVKPSSAYSGPWETAQLTLDVVQACALMDVVNFTMNLVQQTGLMSETIARSLGVLNNYCVKNLCALDEDAIKEAVAAGKPVQVDLKPEFKAHFEQWIKESTELYMKQRELMRKRIVAAKTMPQGGFGPSAPGGGLIL